MAKKKHENEEPEEPLTVTEAAEGDEHAEDSHEAESEDQNGTRLLVRATKVGEYPTGCLRQPGEAFTIASDQDFSENWMVWA